MSHRGASGRKSNPGNSRRIQLAVSSQAVHRSPAKMNSGTPATVCTHCMIRGVGRATLNVLGRSSSSDASDSTASAICRSRGRS